MPNLDQQFTDERLKADSAELQRRLLGQTFHEQNVQLEAAKTSTPAKGDESFVAPANLRSDAEIDALIKPTPAADPAAKKVPFGFHEPGVVVGESIGPAAEGAMKVLEDPRNAWLGLGPLGMTKMASGAKGLLRPRFNVEETIQRALNPSPLAERVTQAINSKTAVLTDVDAEAQAAALVQSGGVNRDTLVQYAPGTALLSAPHALAAQEVLTQESRTFIDTARHAIDTNDPQLADQAMAQFSRLLDPAGGFSGAVTTTGQTLRVASSEDIKALNLLLERSSKTATGMSPLEQLKVMMADPATDPAKQGKSLTQAFRNVVSQAKEVVATGDHASAEVLLHQLQTSVDEVAQLDMFVTPKEVKEAQKVYKSVTAQHIVEANQQAARQAEGTFKLTPTGPAPFTPVQQKLFAKPIKAGDQITDDQIRAFNERLALAEKEQSTLTHTTAPGGKPVQQSLLPKPIKPGSQITDDQIREYNRQVALAAEEKFALTAPKGGAVSSKGKQADFVAEEERNKLATIKEHQAQDLRVSEGTSVFSPKREPFKLTPPPGGAKRPSPPKQLDLLTMIAKEPEPEQLALEMAAAIEHPELSKQFLTMIRKAQDAITFGKTKEVGDTLQKLQSALTPKVKDAGAVSQPARMTTIEKKALQQFFVKNPNSSLTDLEMLKALVNDPSLQPDALINALNNLKKPGWKDGAQYLLINSMLTPASVFVNFAATASMLPVHIAARGMGAKIGQVSRLLGGKEGVITGESEAMIHGLYTSFWDSVKLGGRVARTGDAEIGPWALKENAIGTHPITADALFENKLARYAAGIPESPTYNSASFPTLSRAGLTSKAINFFGTATGIPGRLMLTGDQFIQSLAMNAEMHAQVYRQASAQALQDGYTLKEFYQAYAPLWRKLQRDMPEDIRKKGEEFSLEVSLNTPPGPIGKNILSLREKVNEATGIGGTIALPFYNTLANSAKATWEFSPLAPASNALGLVAKTFRSDMFGDDPVKRDLAVGKWAFGTMLMSSLVWAAVNGRLTGRGPDNKELQQQGWEAQGLPDSWIYNTDTGERVQISRLGILSNLAGMSADVAEVWLQADERTRAEMAQLLVTAYVGNLSFDFLQSSAGVTQAIVNGVKRKEDVDILAKSIGAFVPLGGTIRSAEKALAPADNPQLMKDARTSLDKMLARFPGYDSLAKQFGLDPIPVLRNQFGYAVRQPQAAFGTEWFNPLYISGPSQNETLQKLSQIQIDLGVKIQRPSNVIGDGKMPLTAQEYDAYERMAGKQWEQRAEQLLPLLERKDIPDQVKRDMILHHLMESRRTATAMLKGQSHDLVEAMTADKVQRYTQPTSPKRVTRPPSLRQE